ncbi:hypothetical protein ORV05_02165 [Amycolatopsis cynarae]|uniref:Uncharacterized protein n=1 Tax=Amycolatopsis cynarae TaxID=2995223 RepID=A0ABY7B3Z2_9PSEU|nr:hypothetical protein [Amycolatopsis sp. HUAS 11-8]WAL66644.1 hypothetical protein ORV05_02165 [Amycolatopsis sp. HUAS 11-8]
MRGRDTGDAVRKARLAVRDARREAERHRTRRVLGATGGGFAALLGGMYRFLWELFGELVFALVALGVFALAFAAVKWGWYRNALFTVALAAAGVAMIVFWSFRRERVAVLTIGAGLVLATGATLYPW